jgi:hypothetical protein
MDELSGRLSAKRWPPLSFNPFADKFNFFSDLLTLNAAANSNAPRSPIVFQDKSHISRTQVRAVKYEHNSMAQRANNTRG